ncbi:immunoglobulin-binding protein 1b [Cloeon dipterum]|uniref:immunoglobulin-binding protein 1b n=1 Tax=Cloeon dipterum TaxID=197152 RepID=UPI003220406F
MDIPEKPDKKISELYKEGFLGLEKVNNSSEATNSGSVQSQVRQAQKALEDCTRLVSTVDMFSPNESIEEVSSLNLRYLLLPALLGKLTLKLATDASGRFEVVKLADAYFKDFLRRCRDYGAVDHETVAIYLEEQDEQNAGNGTVVPIVRDRNPDLTAMVQKRNDKIRRFQEEKERERRLKELQELVERDDADDERVREYHMTLLKSNIAQALDELASLQQEKNILQHMERLKKESAGYDEVPQGQRPPSRRPPPQRQGLKPVIITKDQAMKQVFGAGYPSLPVMTVDEFYEQRVSQGKFPGGQAAGGCGSGGCSHSHGHGQEQDQAAGAEVDQVVREYQQERDDPELLARDRAMDEFKDDHRRGEGNRHNRS